MSELPDDAPRFRVEFAGLDHRTIGTHMDAEHAAGVPNGAIAKAVITGLPGGPEEQRRRLQRVDAAEGAPNLARLLGFLAKRDHVQRASNIVRSDSAASSASARAGGMAGQHLARRP
ncbi:MAG: hypothetical protein WDN49_17720 [Acetobacteraceae bacterium]